MLAPKRQKYRKQFRGSWRRIAVKGEKLNFGNVGLKTEKSRRLVSYLPVQPEKVVNIGYGFFLTNRSRKNHQRLRWDLEREKSHTLLRRLRQGEFFLK